MRRVKAENDNRSAEQGSAIVTTRKSSKLRGEPVSPDGREPADYATIAAPLAFAFRFGGGVTVGARHRHQQARAQATAEPEADAEAEARVKAFLARMVRPGGPLPPDASWRGELRVELDGPLVLGNGLVQLVLVEVKAPAFNAEPCPAW